MRSIDDWLKAAQQATTDQACGACLESAQALVTSCFEWRQVLSGATLTARCTTEHVRIIAEKTLLAATADRAVWGFRDVAAIAKSRLGELTFARQALEAGVKAFSEPRTQYGQPVTVRGYEWVLLAEGFGHTLDDQESLLSCLALGIEAARKLGNADDLVRLAESFAKWGSLERAAALMREAEALSLNGTANPWTVSNGWRTIGSVDDAHRLLQSELNQSTTSGQALQIAHAYGSHHETAFADAAWSESAKLAKTAKDWLALVDCAGEAKLSETRIREAIGNAERLAVDDLNKGRVALANSVWLKDEALAQRLGFQGVRPSQLKTRQRQLTGFEPSADALFDFFRSRLSAKQQREIAESDYHTDVEKHLAAIEVICLTGRVPLVLDWEPHEVLALTRWSSGDSTDHVARGFSALMLALVPGGLDEWVTNGPILFESCLALGPECVSEARRFFAWMYEVADHDDVNDQLIALLIVGLAELEAGQGADREESLARLLKAFGQGQLIDLVAYMADSMACELWRHLLSTAISKHEHRGLSRLDWLVDLRAGFEAAR